MLKILTVLAVTLFPPKTPDWKPWFAWYPVTVEAYKVSEINNGFYHTVWFRWVETYEQRFTNVDDEDQRLIIAQRFRLPQ